jgi:flagellar protein FliJ
VPLFRFRLSTLLRLRQTARDEFRQNLAAAHQAEDLVLARINVLNYALTDLRQHSADASRPGTLDANQLLTADRYKATVQAQLQTARDQHRSATAEVERCRQALVEADRAVKTLEMLRQRQSAQHQGDENRRSIKELDEVSLRKPAG